MEFFKKEEKAIFIFEDLNEKKEFFKFLNFMNQILKNQEFSIKAFSKEMELKIKKIIKEIEEESFLKLEENFYFTNREDFIIILDNTLFVLKGLLEFNNKKTIKDAQEFCSFLLEEFK